MDNMLTIVAIVLGLTQIFLLTLGGFLVYLFRRTQENSKDLGEFKQEVYRDYVHEDDLKDLDNKIDALFQQVFTRLDNLNNKLFQTQLKQQDETA